MCVNQARVVRCLELLAKPTEYETHIDKTGVVWIGLDNGCVGTLDGIARDMLEMIHGKVEVSVAEEPKSGPV